MKIVMGIQMGLGQSMRRPFVPTDQADLMLWLDASYGVLHGISPDLAAANGETVYKWVNKVAPGVHDAIQAVGGLQPTYNAPLKKIVTDGSDDVLISTQPVIGNDWCVMVVGMINAGPSPIPRLISIADSVNDFDSNTSAIPLIVLNGALVCYHNGNVIASVPFTASQRFCAIVNATPTGTSIAAYGVSDSGVALSAAVNASNFYIAAGREANVDADWAKSDLEHVLFFSSSRTADEILQLQAWADAL